MGLFKAIGEAIERSVERERDRMTSLAEIEDQIVRHNRAHNDQIVVVPSTKVVQPSSCVTGLYGWADRYKVPLGTDVALCARCGRYHVASAMEGGA